MIARVCPSGKTRPPVPSPGLVNLLVEMPAGSTGWRDVDAVPELLARCVAAAAYASLAD
jgi:hypothetical protein